MRLAHRLIALIAVLALALALGLGVAACGGDDEEPADGETTAAEKKDVKVGVTQIVSHPALDACVSGFQEVMADEGWVEGENVTYDLQNAQGDMATATSIADKFAADNMDLVFSVATPTSQAMVKASDTIPIVFCAVTDPVGSGLVADAEKPDANVTGVSDMQPIEPILELAAQLMPDAKSVGMIYNAGESNSVFLAEQAKADAEAAGYEFVEATAGTTAEVQAAAESLVGRAEAVMVVGDNTAVSALEAIVKVCQENGMLLLAGDIDSVKRGAAAGFGFDYEDLGRQAGAQAAKILSGTPVADVPVEFASNLILAVNPESAEKMDVTIPQDVLDEAQETF